MTKTFASLAVALAVGIGVSLAATQVPAMAAGPEDDAEFRGLFHGHVATASIAPAAVHDRHLVVGGVIPEGIVLHPVPHDVVLRAPEFADHHYIVVNDHIHVVHPNTRAVTAVIGPH